MDNRIYIGIPVIAAILVEIFYPYLHTIDCDVWFSPPIKINIILFLASMILLGFTLYRAVEIEDNYLISYCVLMSISQIVIAITIFDNNKLSIGFLLLSIILASVTHNTIFLSPIVEENNDPLYLNLYSIFIVYLGFLLSIAYENADKKITMEYLKEKKSLGKKS